MKKVYFVVSVDWFFLSHRLPIALEAQRRGYDVSILTTDTGRKTEIEAFGLKFIDVKFVRSGKNPLKEFFTIYSLWKIFKKDSPDIIHLVAIKPCVYGSIAAKFSRINGVINAITGLGFNFTNSKRGLFQTFLLNLLRYSLKSNYAHYIFQNNEDASFFIKLINLKKKQYSLIKGCGIDLEIFAYQEESDEKVIRFVLPARLLYDKGIIEFAQAATRIKDFAFGKAEFVLVGSLDPDNLASITIEELNKYLIKDYIIWAGYSSDINSVLKNCHVVVLPSYREGLPKSLIEASAVGRPIITTNAPGCRDCVIDGINGFIIPIKDVELMAERMKSLIESKDLRCKMGLKSREIAKKEFALDISLNATMDIYNKMIN